MNGSVSGTVRPASAAPRSRHAGRRQVARWVLVLAGVLVVAIGAAYGVAGWYFSGLIEPNLDVESVRYDAEIHSYPISVLQLEPAADGHATITLVIPRGGQRELLLPGVWGLQSANGGFGQAGAIQSTAAGTVTREYWPVSGPAIGAGDKVALVNDSFPDNPLAALGLAYRDVAYRGPLGTYPAWFIPGTSSTWAILVHGKGLTRRDEMEEIEAVRHTGLPMLVISFRNDLGAPRDPSGRIGYGAIEWPDLEAAVRYALGQGAPQVVLVGRSMGGAVVAAFLENSSLASRVGAVVLDSPMLDFSQTIDHAASHQALPVLGTPVPRSLVAFSKLLMSWRYGIDWSTIDYLAGDGRLRAPLLVFHGTADEVVPDTVSLRLARDRPDLVTLVLTEGAGHSDSWNLDPARYDAVVQAFVAQHVTG